MGADNRSVLHRQRLLPEHVLPRRHPLQRRNVFGGTMQNGGALRRRCLMYISVLGGVALAFCEIDS